MSATRLDLILSFVKARETEVTIDTDGYTREQVGRVIATAKAAGLSACFDGRFLLIRDLCQLEKGDLYDE